MSHTQQKKRRQSPGTIIFTAVLLILAAVCGWLLLTGSPASETFGQTGGTTPQTTAPPPEPTVAKPVFLSAQTEDILSRLSTAQAMLIDLDDDRVLFSVGADTICYPASVTKLMTAAVALTYCRPDETVTVGSEIKLAESDASTAGLQAGWEVSVGTLLEGLLLPSGADAAYALAVHTARTVHPDLELSDAAAQTAFCELMNDQAEALGCENTNFANPDGYHSPAHYSTPADMALICRAALSYPEIVAACALPLAEETLAGGAVNWKNSNPLIVKGSPWYYPPANGLKTGFTDDAGHCLAATAEENGTRLLALVFHCPTYAQRSYDVITLFEAGFTLLNEAREPLVYEAPDTGETDKTK